MTVILIELKSCNTLLHMLLVCIHSSLKSFLTYQCLVLDTKHLGTVYLREQRYEDPWLFFES
jgi:hypothetical protein